MTKEELKDLISFCEFYKEPINVSNVDDLCKIKWNNVTVLEMLESISEKDMFIY